MAKHLNSALLSALPEGVAAPAYDRSALRPGILHVGVGNFHRAHMAVYLDRLFALGKSHDWALVGAGVRPGDAAMRDRLAAQDWLTTVIELDPNGLSAQVTGAMIDFVEVDADKTIARMTDEDIRIVSLTITEGGYYVNASTGGFDAEHPDMAADAASPDAPKSVFGMIIKALRLRRDAGRAPFTVMSCDNLPENGHVAKQTVTGLARLSDPALADWIASSVAFPNSMVDCITPATSDRERDMVRDTFGIIDTAPVVCEPFRQWVLEDTFPQGRPELEQVGAEFVANVAPYELMKLRILNGGHAAIAYPSALLGHHFVHDAMADPRIRNWLSAIETREFVPSLEPIPGVSFKAYFDKILERFSNPRIGDTVQRLCFDGTNRQPKFVLPILSEALERDTAFQGIALEVALWCRYCAGTDDAGQPMLVNDDNAETLTRLALEAKETPSAFLTNKAVFGDLAESDVFQSAFAAWLDHLWTDGVESTLQAYVNQTG
ncbi:mannitol dehydrogenase family protein [Puniceibacterium confluentis]|uniref:mannitol dehydrogenase family protein n=1 Tax=Puniceibacterium confluentis TaxID=1958944 RepID=UPI0011B7E722|nr:mannitol dehydrogenase family protein [Puniceibacterium confluentis]